MERENKFFIKGIDLSIWKVVKKELFVHTHEVNGIVVNKFEKD